MPGNILQVVLDETVRKAPVFAILADETTNSSNREQLVGLLCIRGLREGYEVFEEPVGLIQLTDTTTTTIISAIQDAFLRLVLPLKDCRSQANAGAGTFQGHMSGVAVAYGVKLKHQGLFPYIV